MNVRRIITGHSKAAKAVVLIDQIVDKPISRRPGAFSAPIWQTAEMPVSNDESEDTSQRHSAVPQSGTAFRVMEFMPGVQARVHRTNSIDYVVVMSGEMDMEMDGTVVHITAGDVLVQRGTIHNWINNGTEPCRIAVVVVDAKPAIAGEKQLDPVG